MTVPLVKYTPWEFLRRQVGDPTTDGSPELFYIDGNPERSATLGSTLGSGNLRYGFVGVGSEAVVFDGGKNPSPYYYIGDVDDLRIYHRALSAGEVAGLAGRTVDIHKPF